MNRSNLMSAAVLSAVLVIAACGGSSSKASNTSSSSPSSSSSSITATTAVSTSTTSGPSTTAASGAPILSVATNSKVGKQIIVDGSGKTVYMYEPDGASRMSQVPSGIKGNWPGVKGTETSTVGSGLDMSKYLFVNNPDHTTQALYNNHLLYTFINDNAPGDANGQALGGVWFTLSPAGDKNP